MQGPPSHDSIHHETRLDLVSPVTAKIEADNYGDYMATELSYENSLSQDPDNPLLLANYAQFLYLVSNDYDIAEEHFKRDTVVDPPDAEAYNKYASFLWRATNDLWTVGETFLGAISADPTNSFYAADYAHFLWNTGVGGHLLPSHPSLIIMHISSYTIRLSFTSSSSSFFRDPLLVVAAKGNSIHFLLASVLSEHGMGLRSWLRRGWEIA